MTIEDGAPEASKIPKVEKTSQIEKNTRSHPIEAATPKCTKEGVTLVSRGPGGDREQKVAFVPGNRKPEDSQAVHASMEQMAEFGPRQETPPSEAQRQQAEKMKDLGLEINIGADQRYQDLVKEKEASLRQELGKPGTSAYEAFAGKYNGYSEDTDYFIQREARVRALDEFASSADTAQAAQQYKQESVWFDEEGKPDSTRDLYYERASKRAEDKTRERLLAITGNGEVNGQGGQLDQMAREYMKINFSSLEEEFRVHNEGTSQDVKTRYAGQETATFADTAQAMKDSGRSVMELPSTTMRTKCLVMAFLGSEAPKGADPYTWYETFDGVMAASSSVGEGNGNSVDYSREQLLAQKSILVSVLELIEKVREALAVQKQAEISSSPVTQPPVPAKSS